MWPESGETQQGRDKPAKLRSGLTTGSCATVCAYACAEILLGQPPNDSLTYSIRLPKGKLVDMALSSLQYISPCQARADTIKDAGDDPDVTHGATVFVELSLTENPGITFRAGPGVGTVTQPGLALAVGEPAINPVPRTMITQHLELAAREHDYHGGFIVSVGVENGEAIALKTMNPRLGIVGGLSILGTTGVVRPFSCSAYIASIHQGVDVARANGHRHIGASTGNRSETFLRQQFSFPDMALIEMGDFIGALLKHLRNSAADNATPSISRLSLCGGFGKFTKLACGAMDLHSKASSIDFHYLQQSTRELGGTDALCQQVASANTSIAALDLCQQANIDLASKVCKDAWQHARKIVPDNISLDLWAINRQGELIGQYPEAGL